MSGQQRVSGDDTESMEDTEPADDLESEQRVSQQENRSLNATGGEQRSDVQTSSSDTSADDDFAIKEDDKKMFPWRGSGHLFFDMHDDQ